MGESAVGKSFLVRRYILDDFDGLYIATLGAKPLKKELRLRSGTGEELSVILTIFDIMGVPTFRDLLRDAYFTGAQGILAVFDLTRPETLATLGGWVEAARGVAGRVPVVVLGNKVDLVDRARAAGPLLEAAAAIPLARLPDLRQDRGGGGDGLQGPRGLHARPGDIGPARRGTGTGVTADSPLAPSGTSLGAHNCPGRIGLAL